MFAFRYVSVRIRSFDHACVAHCLWLKMAQIKMEAYVDRVPTKDNIADLPSREEYGLLMQIGARHIEAKLDTAFMAPGAWDSLSVLGKL